MTPLQQFIHHIETANLWHTTTILQRNAFLKMGGTIDTNLYFVVEGSLRLFFADEAEEQTIRFGYKGDFVAALDSFITEQASSFYIQALRQTQLKVLRKSVFLELIHHSTERLLLWNAILQQQIVEQMEREQDLLITSPRARYERVLSRSPQLFQEIPHKYIAAYLRMSPETLSRLKKS